MKEYLYCPKCSRLYNVSALRDKSRIFVCEDCVRWEKHKMNGVKYVPVYNRAGFARVNV